MVPTPKLNATQQATTQTVPAPIGGLNGRDALADMDKLDAYFMDNIIPGTASVKSRRGNEKFSSDTLGAPVQGLEVYTGGAGDKMLAFAGGKIIDVSIPLPSTLVSGKLGNLPVTTMFSNASDNSQHLIITTGLDIPMHYDGAALTDLALTGMVGAASTLNSVFAFKGRLYWGQKDKIGFYYLPVGAIQGALSYFDLAQVSRLGGYLVAIASFSENTSGDGPNDYIVFITSKGECIVYAGFDPSSADNWGLVGRYYCAEPIGKKCTVNFASELVILTLEGALSFSDVRATGNANARSIADAQNGAITSKLGAYLSQYNVNKGTPGWSGQLYTSPGSFGWLILNVPNTGAISGEYSHFVMNTTNNSWCRFTNWNGLCFTVYNGQLFFGRFDGYVMLADVGGLDDGQAIKCDVKQAYNYFDDGNGLGFLQKHFQWASLLVSCDGTPPLSGQFNVDYVENAPQYVNMLDPGSGAPWDTTPWDTGFWGDDGHTQRFIVTLNRGGVVGSLWLRAQLNGLTLEWFATQYVLEKTRGLLI